MKVSTDEQVLNGRLHTKRVSWHVSHSWRGTRQRSRNKAPVCITFSSEEVTKSCHISKTWCRIRETGVLRTARPDASRPCSVWTTQFEDTVLQRTEDNPSTSTGAIAIDLNTSNANVWNVLHEMGMQPFKIQKVQDLSANDFPQHVAFCQWYLHQIVNIPDFHTSVLFTDEATFTREGIFNSHNSHVWDFVNPKATGVFRHQHRFTINVWAGIVHDHLIEPYLLPNRLGGGNYIIFICNILPEMLENVPLQVRQHLWFQHDGDPAHIALDVREYPNNVFPNRWIGRGGPIQWLPRSPNLTPMDFFFWGTWSVRCTRYR